MRAKFRGEVCVAAMTAYLLPDYQDQRSSRR